jgi:hypothetical protein
MCVFAVSAVAWVLAAAAFGAVDVTTTVSTPYNKFLVADLGLTKGGSKYPVFSVAFSGLTGGQQYSLEVTVERVSDGKQLLTGSTNSVLGSVINNNTYTNYQLADVFTGGNFSVSEDEKQLQDQVLATGALPQGSYRITLTLNTGGGTDSIVVQIVPPYLQPVSPVDVSATRDVLAFRWATNINRNGPVEFHLFTDPGGNREVTYGGSLPQRGITGSSLDGSTVAPYLVDGTTYYWQIWGVITTTHGQERVKSALSRFRYYESSTAAVVSLGLTDAEKSDIKSELLAILEELVNKRAAKSISRYEFDRAVLDNGVVSYEEIMAILSLIRQKQATVNAIYFK